MIKCVTLHEDIFYEHFKPYRHPKAKYNTWGGLGLETFGGDLELVHRYPPDYVWTVLEDRFGDDYWIVPGVHFVNRICYLFTELPHYLIPIEIRVKYRPRIFNLTPLGLSRQISQVKRLHAKRQALGKSLHQS